MAKDSIYVVGPTSRFEEKYDAYVAKGFENRGEIKYSLDGTQVLVEEAPEMFDEEDLTFPGVQTFTEEEIKQFLIDNKVDWEEDTLLE